MPRTVPTDRLGYLRLRWRARVVTVVVAVPFGLMLAELVVRARSDDPFLHKSAAWVFFQLGLYSIVGALVLWFTWRRSFHARPVVLRHDAGPGETMGVPELDEPPRPHVGLSGQVEPPSRW